MRRPVVLTDAELAALVYVSNVALDDYYLWEDDGKVDKRGQAAHKRVNAKLRAEAARRGWRIGA